MKFIFVNDGSTDGTLDKLRAILSENLAANRVNRQIKIIRFTRNFGQTPAMQAGFDNARGKVVVSLDGDLQNDPADIPKFLSKISEGYDIVCGWRMDRKDKALTRILPSKVANWLIGKITGVPIHDNGCSLKAYRKFVIKSIHLYSDMHRFIPAMASILGASVTEIVVNHRARQFGTTKYGLSRIWKVLFDMMSLKMIIHFYNNPLLWFGLLSLLFFVAGIVTLMISFVLILKDMQSIVFLSSSFLFFFLFGSILSWGILSEYLVRIEKGIDKQNRSIP